MLYHCLKITVQKNQIVGMFQGVRLTFTLKETKIFLLKNFFKVANRYNGQGKKLVAPLMTLDTFIALQSEGGNDQFIERKQGPFWCSRQRESSVKLLQRCWAFINIDQEGIGEIWELYVKLKHEGWFSLSQQDLKKNRNSFGPRSTVLQKDI